MGEEKNDKNYVQRCQDYMPQDEFSMPIRHKNIKNWVENNKANRNIYTMNRMFQSNSDKENDHFQNLNPSKKILGWKYLENTYVSLLKEKDTDIYNQIMNFEINKTKFKPAKEKYLSSHHRKNSILSNKMNLVQQEEPQNANYIRKNKLIYWTKEREEGKLRILKFIAVTETFQPHNTNQKNTENSKNIVQTSHPKLRKTKYRHKKFTSRVQNEPKISRQLNPQRIV